MREIKFGDYLVEKGVITREQLEEALTRQKEMNDRVGNILVKLGFTTEEAMIDSLADYLSIERIEGFVHRSPVKEVPAELVRKYKFFPIDRDEKFLYIVTDDPLNVTMTDELKYRLNKKEIITYIATSSEIEIALHRWYSEGRSGEEEEEEMEEGFMEAEGENLDGPAIRFFNTIIEGALLENASDVHIEPFEDETRVRYRIDGSLQLVNRCSPKLHESLVSRIKVQSGMDITIKTVSQDGKISMAGGDIDLRISTLPIIHGEKVVIRILDKREGITSLEDLGYERRDYAILESSISLPYGLIIITGPTGSGKTTTLYSLLDKVRSEDVNIVTIEDPPEQQFKGVNQVAINEKKGITFAGVLRSILRQDPDIIMVGEIRDSETAALATKAALTGHLVLSTLHTNDACATINRLLDMGVASHLLTPSLVGVMAQRLVRLNCPRCTEEYEASEEERILIKRMSRMEPPEKLYLGAGCKNCNHTGFRGRTGIHELLAVTHEIRNLILHGASTDELREKALEQGMVSMVDDGLMRVKNGTVALQELMRVVYTI